MSLILDALNRSRRDPDEVPGLATEHYLEPGGEEKGKLSRYLPWLALLAALLVIAWLLSERGGQQTGLPGSRPVVTEPAVSQASVPDAGAPPSAPRAIDPPPSPTPEPAPTPQPDATVADLYQQRKPEPAAQARETTGAPAQDVAAARPEEQPVDIEKMVLKARDELENSRLAEHPAPFLVELSQQTKDRIPTIYYESHDYSGEPSRSLVVLNGKQLRVGGSPAAGLKVDEILPDSVVLNYRGTQFRLRALNSWINL